MIEDYFSWKYTFNAKMDLKYSNILKLTFLIDDFQLWTKSRLY